MPLMEVNGHILWRVRGTLLIVSEQGEQILFEMQSLGKYIGTTTRSSLYLIYLWTKNPISNLWHGKRLINKRPEISKAIP